MEKEKMAQIYEAMADITLGRLNKIKESEAILDKQDIEMVSATLNLYLATADNPVPDLFGLLDEKTAALEKKVRIIKDSVNAGMRIEFKD